MLAGCGGPREGLVSAEPLCQPFTEEQNSGMKAPDAKGVALIIGVIGTTLGVPIGFQTASCPDWIVAMALVAAVFLVSMCLQALAGTTVRPMSAAGYEPRASAVDDDRGCDGLDQDPDRGQQTPEEAQCDHQADRRDGQVDDRLMHPGRVECVQRRR
jgi:hypothetical protein